MRKAGMKPFTRARERAAQSLVKASILTLSFPLVTLNTTNLRMWFLPCREHPHLPPVSRSLVCLLVALVTSLLQFHPTDDEHKHAWTSEAHTLTTP